MAPTSRRKFLQGVRAFALLPSLRTAPELVLYRANIITIDPLRPRASAIAIANGRFLAVGDDEEVRALAGPRTAQLDLEGRTVVPGFIDAHAHPASAGRSHLRRVDCDLRSIAAIRGAIRERAARTPAGQWVLGFKYDDTKTEEGRPLTRQDLGAPAGGTRFLPGKRVPDPGHGHPSPADNHGARDAPRPGRTSCAVPCS